MPPILEKRLERREYATTPAFKRIAHHTAVSLPDGSLVAVTGPAGDASSEAYADLFAAAPEMARALRFMLDAFPKATASEDEARARDAAREALHKAGVPLP